MQAEQLSFIRDAEVESTIRAYATPVWKAAGLDPDFVQVHLINDPTLNAFVSGGQHIFVNTGLLIRADNADQVIGVLAHESGHIAGGHLTRFQDAMSTASYEAIAAMLLGIGATVAGHGGEGGIVAMEAGQDMALRGLLAYSRTQEASADQAGMRFLDKAGLSARGFLKFMEVLQSEEYLSAGRQDPYLRTHPLTEERVASLREFVARSPNSDHFAPPFLQEMHRRMQAKLYAFLNPPGFTMRRYPPGDHSIAARYARAIATCGCSGLPSARPQLAVSLELTDGLIEAEPGNGYFQELKGQTLFANGRVAESVPFYQRAVADLPRQPLLLTELAQAELETGDKAFLSAAVAHIKTATEIEPDNPDTWHQASIAYGREGDMGHAAVAMAEEALASGDAKAARREAARAEKLLPMGSRGWLRAQDIEAAARPLDRKE